ncbi:MAG: DNA repair protein RadC [Oscillospiraceae bacterium]|nr:DNA repair protein RadC [Oscillospiraceae bacterium]
MSIHDKHRQRVRQRFLEEGLDNFSDFQALELLLFYCIPRIDTNEIAHRLINRFGSFSQVLDAPVQELEKVEGIGPSAALFLSLVCQTGRYYQVDRVKNTSILTSTDACGAYLVPYFHGRRNETVFLLCLDAKCKVLCCKEVGEGSVNSAGVPVRRIVETALGANATSVVLAHNHPSGLALPSADDVQTTQRVAAALAAVEIAMADHIIVADDDFVSLAQSGYYRP